jgi:DNA-binding XRE family transcriptional regulator
MDAQLATAEVVDDLATPVDRVGLCVVVAASSLSVGLDYVPPAVRIGHDVAVVTHGVDSFSWVPWVGLLTLAESQRCCPINVSHHDMSALLTSRTLGAVTAERDYYRGVGRMIRSARRSAELTQQDLADEVDLSRTSITNIENGNQPVSLWLLNLIAVAVDREPAGLLPSTSDETRAELPRDVPAKTAAFIRGLGGAR